MIGYVWSPTVTRSLLFRPFPSQASHLPHGKYELVYAFPYLVGVLSANPPPPEHERFPPARKESHRFEQEAAVVGTAFDELFEETVF